MFPSKRSTSICAVIVAGLISASSGSRDWMKAYQDKTLLQLVLPGSHDSCAYRTCAPSVCSANGGLRNTLIRPWAETQALSVRRQLDLGVRYLDVRVRMNGARVWTAHNLLMVPLADALRDIAAFASDNPTEVVVVKLRESGGKVPVAELVAELAASGVECAAVPVRLHAASLREMRAEGQLVFLADEGYSAQLPFPAAPYVAGGDDVLKKWWANVPYFSHLCAALRRRTSAAGFFDSTSVEAGKINVIKA